MITHPSRSDGPGKPHAGINIAVLIPCRNEEVPIPNVVRGFARSLPHARIYVYDNRSTDRTAEAAREAGAIVGFEPHPGKGNVLRRMFSDIEADLYVVVDGDDTYDADAAPVLIRKLLEQQLDMVNAVRISGVKDAYRFGHRTGNRALNGLVHLVFGYRFQDMLSGYRVLTRRFVKSFPTAATGFEIETELAVHAAGLGMKTAEIPTTYRARPDGSASKLNSIPDGLRIVKLIGYLVKEERPLLCFVITSLVLALTSFAVALPVVNEFLETGLVPRLPTAVLAAATMLAALLALACGLILDTVTHARRELRRLAYLSIPPPDWFRN